MHAYITCGQLFVEYKNKYKEPDVVSLQAKLFSENLVIYKIMVLELTF